MNTTSNTPLTYPASPLVEGENVHDIINEIDQLLADLDTITNQED